MNGSKVLTGISNAVRKPTPAPAPTSPKVEYKEVAVTSKVETKPVISTKTEKPKVVTNEIGGAPATTPYSKPSATTPSTTPWSKPSATTPTTSTPITIGNGSSSIFQPGSIGNGSANKTTTGNGSWGTPTGSTSGTTGGTSGSTGTTSTGTGASVDTTTSTSNTVIAVRTAEIEANIKKLNSIVEQLQSVWNDIKANQITAINNSWVGSVASTYTAKVEGMEPKVKAACSSLELIANTYSKAIKEISEKESDLTNKVASI